MLEKGLYNPV